MTDSTHPTLEMSAAEFRELGYSAVDLIADAMDVRSRGDELARRAVPEAIRESLMAAPLPETGTDPSALFDQVAAEVFPYPLGHNNPRFFAWVNSPAAPIGILAELLAAGMNSSVAGGDQAATYVEHGLLNWLKQIMGFPNESGGLLVSGGSMATLVGLTVMRYFMSNQHVREAGMNQNDAPMIVYTSTEGHSCIQKTVELLGIGSEHLHRIPVDDEFRMDVDALHAQIKADRAAGLNPVCVAATAGTVNTGAIDPLDKIADLCEQENLWLHVDGAFGGIAILAPEVEPLYAGIERADSLGIDPHKWMYVPVECGCAIVRDKESMRNAFSLVPEYLRDDRLLPWFAEFGPQQTRGFRALKLWLAMKQIGVEGYSHLISRDIGLVKQLREKLEAHADFRIASAGPLSVTCFVYAPTDVPSDQVEALNRALLERVQQEGVVYLTSTVLHGDYVLRANIVNFRTTEDDLDVLIDCLVRAGQQVRSSTQN